MTHHDRMNQRQGDIKNLLDDNGTKIAGQQGKREDPIRLSPADTHEYRTRKSKSLWAEVAMEKSTVGTTHSGALHLKLRLMYILKLQYLVHAGEYPEEGAESTRAPWSLIFECQRDNDL